MTEESALGLSLTVLGFVRARRGSTEVELGPPPQRAALALLLAGAGRPVSLETMLDALWSSRPPAGAAGIVHRLISGLRQVLEPNRPARAASRWINRTGAGYQFTGPAGSLDLIRFRQHVERARSLAAKGSTEAAVREYAVGLDLWQDRAAQGIAQFVRAHPLIATLDRERLYAARAAADLALAAGQPEPILSAVAQAADAEPLDQPVHARLMLALAGTGRRAAALSTYNELRARLRDDLGVAPDAEVEEAYRRVLAAPGHAAATRRPLPADPAGFVGRAAETALLNALSARPGAAPPMVITGPGGIGKTALAIRWAHQNSAYYPDGQLHGDLAGGTADTVLAGFLTALGVHDLPGDLSGRVDLYRTRMAGRRMIVVLDDAADAAQVTPLLPGGTGCVTLITGRDPLPGVPGAESLTLAPMPDDQARALLADRLGRARVLAEPEAVARLLALSGRLPLALAVIAARASGDPRLRLATLAGEIAEIAPGGGLREVLTWAYGTLRPSVFHLLRRLATHPGREVPATTAAELIGLPAHETRSLLTDLVHAHLLLEPHPDRYQLPRTVRAHSPADLGLTAPPVA